MLRIAIPVSPAIVLDAFGSPFLKLRQSRPGGSGIRFGFSACGAGCCVVDEEDEDKNVRIANLEKSLLRQEQMVLDLRRRLKE